MRISSWFILGLCLCVDVLARGRSPSLHGKRLPANASAPIAAPLLRGEDVARVYQRTSDPGSKNRNYIIHLPTGYVETTEYPLVFVLHGCMQQHTTIKHDSDMDRLADSEGFIAVYPFITTYDGLRNSNCWGFWFNNEIRRGMGEVNDLAGIAHEVASLYTVDMNRVHMTGLSSGGAMATVAGVAYPDLFASIAPGAGIGYSETAACVTSTCLFGPTTRSIAAMRTSMDNEMSTRKRVVPVLALHSEADCTVQLVLADNIRDSWAALFDFSGSTPTETTTGTTDGYDWEYKKYGDFEGRSIAETHYVKRHSHGWIGGNNGQYAFPNGPDWSAIAWEFFKEHPMSYQDPVEVVIDSAVGDDDTLCIVVVGQFTNPADEVDGIFVRLSGIAPADPTAAVIDGRTFSWSLCGLANDTYYTPHAVARSSTDEELSSEVPGPLIKLGNPPVIPPTITFNAPAVDGQCVSITGLVTGESDLALVEARLQGASYKNVEFDNENRFETDFCGLEIGSYKVEVRATDELGLSATAETDAFDITQPPYDAEVLDSLTNHVAQQRVRTYMLGVGFGSFDVPYTELLATYGSTTPFSLYSSSDNWYHDVSNIPGQ